MQVCMVAFITWHISPSTLLILSQWSSLLKLAPPPQLGLFMRESFWLVCGAFEQSVSAQRVRWTVRKINSMRWTQTKRWERRKGQKWPMHSRGVIVQWLDSCGVVYMCMHTPMFVQYTCACKAVHVCVCACVYIVATGRHMGAWGAVNITEEWTTEGPGP